MLFRVVKTREENVSWDFCEINPLSWKIKREDDLIQKSLQEKYSFAFTDKSITDHHIQCNVELLFFSTLQNTENSLKAIVGKFLQKQKRTKEILESQPLLDY